MLDLQEWRSSTVTLSENPCVKKVCLRQAMRLETSGLEGEVSDLNSEVGPFNGEKNQIPY